MYNGRMKTKLSLLTVCLVGSVLFFSGCSKKSPTADLSPSTVPSIEEPLLTDAVKIKEIMVTGAQLREETKFTESQHLLEKAFNSAVALKDAALAIETGNNLSITYRLLAGEANRAEGNDAVSRDFGKKSLDVYQTLRDNGWFNEKDPGLARNWAHALLYTGKIDEAIVALKASQDLQTLPAAKGDEKIHLAAAYLTQGKTAEARPLIEEGVRLIEKNNGSPVWLIFGMMTKATLFDQTGQYEQAKQQLKAAHDFTHENNLKVRELEVHYLQHQESGKVKVLDAVGAAL